MKYAIKLSADGRIEYATYDKYASEDLVIVDVLPDGDIHDYLYIDNAYLYSPLPEDESDERPSTEERLSALEDELEATKVILGVE